MPRYFSGGNHSPKRRVVKRRQIIPSSSSYSSQQRKTTTREQSFINEESNDRFNDRNHCDPLAMVMEQQPEKERRQQQQESNKEEEPEMEIPDCISSSSSSTATTSFVLEEEEEQISNNNALIGSDLPLVADEKEMNTSSEPESTTTATNKHNFPDKLNNKEDDKLNKKNKNDDTGGISQQLYEGVKNVWGWGKDHHILILSPMMHVTEGIANTVVGVVSGGHNLQEVDDNVLKPTMKTIDNVVLKHPVVDAVVGVLLGSAMKTEEIIKPIILHVLKPIDFLIKKEPEQKEDLMISMNPQ